MSNESIFRDHAPALYAAGLQVIPLHARDKKPITKDWSQFALVDVSPEQQAEWINQYPNSNIGLVLGETSGIIGIDIDTDEKAVYDAIISCLPFSPWERKGKKGLMLAYKYTPIKTHRIKNISGETIVECLSSRTQFVMPPSIHPDTQLPYTENVPLISVLDQLQPLPENIEEILRQAVTDAGVQLSHSGWSKVTEFVPAGSRDTTLTEMAGLFAFAVVRGERTLLEAISMLRSYHSNFVEAVAGDQADISKHIANLVKFLHRDVLDRGKILPPNWDNGLSEDDKKQLGITLGVNETEWEFEALRDYLQRKFEENPEGKPRSEAVEEVLLKVARSKQLSKIDEERILKYIYEVSGLKVSMSVLRARVRELRAGDVIGNDHSEIARAVIKDLEQYNLLRWHGGKFMKWAGAHWVEMNKNLLLSHVSSHYGHLPACKKSSDINGIIKVMEFLAEQGIERRPVRGVNFANGFLTQELKLIPHDPDYGMTYVMPFRYMPEEAGKFPLFARFLGQSWGRDPDFYGKMEALQEAMCVTLFGLGASFQRAILLHGAPSSGKTQLLRIVETLVPTEAKSATPPDSWHDRFMPTQMFGKILNICGELSSKKLIDGQKFKDVIDGSEMHGQYKNQQIFKFKPLVTHWFASNHIPKSEDTSAGFIRRWLFLTFHYPVADQDKIKDLGDLISAQEREAIVSWAAHAITRLIKAHHYTLPMSHKAITEEFSNMNNSVRYFLRESGKVHIGVMENFTDETRLYNSYWTFCSGPGGLKPVSMTVFRQMMRELGAEMGFKLKVSPGKAGMSQAVYEGVTMLAA